MRGSLACAHGHIFDLACPGFQVKSGTMKVNNSAASKRGEHLKQGQRNGLMQPREKCEGKACR